VRQRNDHDQPLTAHTDPPHVVQPGEVIDHETYVVGLTVLDDEPAATKPAAAAAAPKADPDADSAPTAPPASTPKETVR
jgi:hypothetical protein